MTDSELYYDHTNGEVRYTVGRRVTTWQLDAGYKGDDLLETLRDIVETVDGTPFVAPPPPAPIPSAMFTPPVVNSNRPSTVDIPKVSGVSWDDSSGIDDLPVM